MNGASLVKSYCGENQTSSIVVPKVIQYRMEREESCWVMPPYAWFYPGPPPMLLPMGYPAQDFGELSRAAPARSLGWIRWVSGFYG
jgi:hypothetical protein